MGNDAAKNDAKGIDGLEAFDRLTSQALASRQAQAAQARIDFPDIAKALDEVLLSAVQSGSTPEQARRDIKWRWAYDRQSGLSLGKAPPGAMAAAEAYWAEIDNERED